MLTIKKLAARLGVGPDVLRHYTKLGLLEPLQNSENGYRFYDETDAVRIADIKTMRSLEFSLPEIQGLHAAGIPEQLSALEQKETELRKELESLLLKLERIQEVKGYLQKTENCFGFVEDVKRAPIYSVYTFSNSGKLAISEERVRSWADRLPYTHISISLSKGELSDENFNGPYSVRLGYGVIHKYVERCGLDLSEPVVSIPEGRFLILYFKTRDLFSLTPSDLVPLTSKAKELGCRFTHDSSGRILAIEEDNDGLLFYVLIRIRIESP